MNSDKSDLGEDTVDALEPFLFRPHSHLHDGDDTSDRPLMGGTDDQDGCSYHNNSTRQVSRDTDVDQEKVANGEEDGGGEGKGEGVGEGEGGEGEDQEEDYKDCLSIRRLNPPTTRQEGGVDNEVDTSDCLTKPQVKPRNINDDTTDAPNNEIPTSKEEMIPYFLQKCSDGKHSLLKNHIIPKVKKEGYDVRELTNDAYFSASGLHVALLGGQVNTADLLMDEFGNELILLPYKHPKNEGLTALHIAITQDECDQVERMLRDLADSELEQFIHAECKGSFFKKEWNISSTPFTLAVLCKNSEIARILLKYRADPYRGSVECNGETVLHAIARHSLNNPEDVEKQLEILKNAFTNNGQSYRDSMTKLLDVRNDDHMTSLIFSLKIGASSFVQALLDIPWVSKCPQWSYNPLQLDCYDVTVLKQKQTPWNISGLEIFAFNSSKMLHLYKAEPIKTLVDELWQQYRFIHIFGGILHLFYMVLFTVGVLSKNILRRNVLPIDKEEIWINSICIGLTVKSLVCTAMTIGNLIYHIWPICGRNYCKSKSCEGQNDGIGSEGDSHIALNEIGELHDPTASQRSTCNNFAIPLKLLLRCNTIKVNFFILDLFVLIWSILRLAGHQHEATVAVVPLIIGWYCFLSYTLLFQKVFIFMLMLNKMLLTNIIHFGVALLFILLGFGTAFYSLLDPLTVADNHMFPFTTLLNILVRQMLALNDIDDLMDDMRFPSVARAVMFVFFVVATVLLLNTLLASMTDTYSEIKDNKVALWYRVKLQMALAVEQKTFCCLKRLMPNCLKRLMPKPKKLTKIEGKYYLEVHVIKKAVDRNQLKA